MLKIACVLAGIAGIGLILAAVLGVAVDTAGVTTPGIIAAISAGGICAVAWVGLVVNWYQKRTAPVEEEEKPSSSEEKPSSSEEKPKPSSSKSSTKPHRPTHRSGS